MATPHTPDTRDAHEARRVTDETSGHADPSDTPPAEGTSVGPTNPQMDVQTRGERTTGKVVLGVIVAVLLVGIALFILGRVAGLGG